MAPLFDVERGQKSEPVFPMSLSQEGTDEVGIQVKACDTLTSDPSFLCRWHLGRQNLAWRQTSFFLALSSSSSSPSLSLSLSLLLLSPPFSAF